MAPNGKPASYVMQHQRTPLQTVHKQTAAAAEAKDANIRVKNECILFSQSIMSGRWNPTSNAQLTEQTTTNMDGPEPRVLSKKRRDLINAEIRELQNLLPLKKSARERLSYLGILALTNTFIRKATFFKKACISCDTSMSCGLVPEFSSSLSGFLLVFNRDGKILYSSDNILDYLGNTVVELASQGDSIYDFVDKEDHDQVRAQLDIPPHDDRGEARRLSFYCRMSTSRYMKTQMRSWKNKIVHVTGRYHKPEMSNDWSDTVFFAVCTPVESKPVTDVRHHPSPRASEFKVVHGPDMKFLEVPNTVESLLGYKAEELENTSWYQWIYPEDAEQARQQHLKFVKEDGSAIACVLRMIKKDGTTAWVDITAEKSQESIGSSFVCNYIVIQEEDVPYFRIHHNLLPFPEHYTDSQRQYLAYRSTLLSSALNSDVSSTTASPMTSPSGISHGDVSHFGIAQQTFGDNLDTKSILRRQLIKRKMSAIDTPLGAAAYTPEVFAVPPNKMLLRSTSEMPYAAGAYHAPLQHSTSYPETTYHPHMLYRGFSTEESYLAQLHSPTAPSAYLFEGGYTTLAPVRPHTLTFRPSQRSPLQSSESVSPVNGHSAQRNQNNNTHLGLMRHDEHYYTKHCSTAKPLSKSPIQEIIYYQQTSSPHGQVSHSPRSPTQQARPATRGNKRLSSSIFKDVNDIIDGEMAEETATTMCKTLPGSPQQVAVQQQCSVASTSSYGNTHSPPTYHESPKQSPGRQPPSSTACTSGSPSYASDMIQPTNLSTQHVKEEVVQPPAHRVISGQSSPSPPQVTLHSGSPHTQASPSRNSYLPTSLYAQSSRTETYYTSRSGDNKNYHLQYSISTHQPTMKLYQHAAAVAARYAAAQQSQRCDVVEGGPEWMKKYGNMSATEMLFSEADGSPYLA